MEPFAPVGAGLGLERGPYRPEVLRDKVRDFPLAIDQQRQRRRLHAADGIHPFCSRALHGQGLGPRAVDADQPVRLLPAARRIPQALISLARLHPAIGLPNGVIGEARCPEPQHLFCATRQAIDQIKNELAFAAGIRGVHDLRHIVAGQKLRHNCVLIAGGLDGGVLKGIGEKRQAVHSPRFERRIIDFRPHGLHQMPDAPGDDDIAALNKAAPVP